ncbi:MAG: B12-binding domain-containing radical SAM protein [Clostridia bacterium]|nr:B12-binding domain-containing radical SAM protein [Clostridia bacterium]
MKIMFINPSLPVYLRVPSLPLGLVSIASYLEHYGHEVTIVERSVQNVDMREEIEKFEPDVVGISAISYIASLDGIRITALIHEMRPGVPVVWGGPAPSSLPELYLRDGKMDFLTLGEGEVTWKEFIDAWAGDRDFSKIEGLAYLDGDDYICNPIRPVADLSQFPELDWSLIEPQKYFSSFFHCTKMVYLHASKGCPASCTFCSNKQFHQGRNRCRDPKHVMHDIEYLVGKCGANGIYFSDELFLPRREVRNELLQMIIDSGLDFVWGCQMRLGVLKEEDIDFMYKAGCRWILFGIETGSQDMIKKIKKSTDLRLAKPTIDYCEKIGLTVQATFIIGFPDETADEIRQTVELAKELSASLPVLNILTPLPNSEIYFHEVETNPDFHEPRSIAEIAKQEQVMTDTAKVNLSAVPKKDLYVVHYYFQWKDFIGKDSVNNDSFGIVKKLASDTFNRIFKHGLKGFVFGTYRSVKQFSTVFFYSHFFPVTKKKYGLK